MTPYGTAPGRIRSGGWYDRPTGAVYGVAFAPEGRRITAVGLDGVHTWQSATGTPVPAAGDTRDATAVAYTRDGTRITGSRGTT